MPSCLRRTAGTVAIMSDGTPSSARRRADLGFDDRHQATSHPAWRIRSCAHCLSLPGAGVIVSGPSGTGKTTGLTQLGRTHELHVGQRHPDDNTGCRSST